MPAISEPRVIERTGATLAAAGCTDPVNRFLQQLHEAECLLTEALAQARASMLCCEHALARLAKCRKHAALTDAHAADAVLAPASHALARDHTDGVQAECRAPLVRPLTVRESQILQMIVDGWSNRQISEALFLSHRTVERHIANIYLKIDVHNKAEATAYALRRRLD